MLPVVKVSLILTKLSRLSGASQMGGYFVDWRGNYYRTTTIETTTLSGQ